MQTQMSILAAKVDLCIELLRNGASSRTATAVPDASIRLPLESKEEFDALNEKVADKQLTTRNDLVLYFVISVVLCTLLYIDALTFINSKF